MQAISYNSGGSQASSGQLLAPADVSELTAAVKGVQSNVDDVKQQLRSLDGKVDVAAQENRAFSHEQNTDLSTACKYWSSNTPQRALDLETHLFDQETTAKRSRSHPASDLVVAFMDPRYHGWPLTRLGCVRHFPPSQEIDRWEETSTMVIEYRKRD
jgi:thioesterase domain-containing protein